MLTIRPYRQGELPLILQRGIETAQAQVVGREKPGAATDRVAAQLINMYRASLTVPGATILVADWPPGVAVDGPAAHTLLMPQPNPFTGEKELVVLDIYTHPLLRGRRVGGALLKSSEEYARTLGCGSLVAQVAFHNQSSQNMFRAGGWVAERMTVGKRI